MPDRLALRQPPGGVIPLPPPPRRRRRRRALALLAVIALLAGAGAVLYALADLLLRGTPPPPLTRKVIAPKLPPIPQILPPSDPAALKQLTPEAAALENARIPFAPGPNPRAAPLALTAGGTDWQRSLECLTAAVYYEAGYEPVAGQQAVAQVVLNRVRHPAYPHNICGVVFQGAERVTGCQFTFTCDGALRRPPEPRAWGRARLIAESALRGLVYAPVGLSTHYHADYVVPYWAGTLRKTAVIGRHIFYRWNGFWGTPPAFAARYAGGEPGLAALVPPPVEGAAPPLPDPGASPIPGLATLGTRPVLANEAPPPAPTTPAARPDAPPTPPDRPSERYVLGVPQESAPPPPQP